MDKVNNYLKLRLGPINPIALITVCDDDCQTCGLFLKGCAKKCLRWDTDVCEGCPCLNSIWAGTPRIVNPENGEEVK